MGAWEKLEAAKKRKGLPKGWISAPPPYPHMRPAPKRTPNADQRPAQRRIDALIAELDRGSADDALRVANEIAERARLRR